jgi:hypothetical protein
MVKIIKVENKENCPFAEPRHTASLMVECGLSRGPDTCPRPDSKDCPLEEMPDYEGTIQQMRLDNDNAWFARSELLEETEEKDALIARLKEMLIKERTAVLENRYYNSQKISATFKPIREIVAEQIEKELKEPDPSKADPVKKKKVK